MMNSPKKQRRGSQTQTRKGSLRRLNSNPSQDEEEEVIARRRSSLQRASAHDSEDGEPMRTARRRSSLQRTSASHEVEGGETLRNARRRSSTRLALYADEEEKNSSAVDHDGSLTTPSQEPVVLSAEVVYAEPVKVVSNDDGKSSKKRRKHQSKSRTHEEEEKISSPNAGTQSIPVAAAPTTASTSTTNDPSRPKYPRSLVGMAVRIVKILHALLNIIVIRGSVLTRRKLNNKLQDYVLSATTTTEEEAAHFANIVALYEEHISHHLFVFYLSWGRLLVCLIVLMWGTCTSRLPKPIAIYIGMAMHWVDSIRALDSNHWLPTSDYEDEPDPNRSLTAEEEVQTAMAWLHLFWFMVDGFYCRQILKKRKQEELRIQRELYLELVGEEEEYQRTKKRN